MKKIKIGIVSSIVMLSLTGCTSNMEDKAIENGKAALQEKDYDKALSSFQIAIDEKTEDQEVIQLVEILENYDEAVTMKEENKIRESKTILDVINSKYENYIIKEDIDLLKEEVNKEYEIIMEIEDIETLILEEKPLQALEKIEELEKNDLIDKYKEEIQNLKEKVDGENEEETNKITSDTAREILYQKVGTSYEYDYEGLLGENNHVFGETGMNFHVFSPKSNGTYLEGQYYVHVETGVVYEAASDGGVFEYKRPEDVQEYSKRDEYMQKISSAQIEADSVYYGETTYEMNTGSAKVFKIWDDLLNEIYSELKNQLNTNDMNSLKEKQREWINQRDSYAKQIASEFEGGSMYSMVYTDSQSLKTKERCYELVERYMK